MSSVAFVQALQGSVKLLVGEVGGKMCSEVSRSLSKWMILKEATLKVKQYNT